MYVVLVILVLLAPIPIYIAFKSLFENKRNLKAKRAVKDAYKRVIKRYALSISQVNKFGNRLIAIDRKIGKLVLVVYKQGITWEKCFNLDEIIFCQIVKTTNKLSGCIENVSMELTFRNNHGIINFPFFDETLDDMRDLPYRLKKAQYWKRKIQFHLSTFQTNNINQIVRNQVLV